MAGGYVLQGQAAPARFEKLLKIFIIIAVICLAGELIWLFVISPFKTFTRIDITGVEPHSFWASQDGSLYFGVAREEILLKAGVDSSSSFFSTDVRAIENALMEIASFESARVLKYFPGRLHIVLEGRRPVAASLASLNGRTIPVLFDSQGVIFDVGGAALYGALPVLSGLVIEEPFPGMRLPGQFIPFLKGLEQIETSSPELLSAVSEFKIIRKPFEGFDLLLYPAHKKIKIRLAELNERMLRYALLMVDVLSSREDGIDTLDFRSGVASYIPKEAYSE